MSWRAKKKSVADQSTCETEYIAMAFAGREAIWLRQVNYELGSTATKQIVILGDKQLVALQSKVG